MGGPNQDKGLHANRKYSTAWSNGAGKGRVFRRQHHLYADETQKSAIQTCFGQQQNLNVSGSFDPTDSTMYPQLWAKANKLRRVPKVVICSTYCNWWEMWERCAFMYPNAQPFSICGQPLNQYCGVYQFDVANYGKPTYIGGGHTSGGQLALFESGGQYNRCIGVLDNPMSQQHVDLTASWNALAETVNNDANDPLYIVVPQWCPPGLESYWNNQQCFDYVFNGRPWYNNINPEYDIVPNAEGSYIYPASDKPRNQNPFGFPSGVPCLLTSGSGFLTNVLHVWCGHWCQTLLGTSSCFGFESWPSGPAGDYLTGGIFEGSYTLNSTILSGLNGTRSTWYDCGPPFGFSTVTGSQLVDYYDRNGVLGSSAQSYIDNHLKFRNIGVRLFTYDQSVDPSGLDWSIIKRDQLVGHEGRFYFGSDHCCDPFGDPPISWCNEDDTCLDTTDPSGLKFGEFISHRPINQVFRDADSLYWSSKILPRLQAYYSRLNSGTQEFYNAMIAKYSLDSYNVAYGGTASDVQGNSVIDYARQYFDEQERNGL